MGILDAPARPAESLGTKLRRLAAEAATKNPWNKPYMRACPPWQPSTAYIRGQVVVNGGNRYVCITAGTSDATIADGPTHTNGTTPTTDGTVVWTFFGYNDVTTDPSLTQPAWEASTAYVLGDQVINDGKVYGCVDAGTSAGSGGPTGVTNSETDNGVVWTYMGVYRPNPYEQDFPTYTYSESAPAGLTTLFNPANFPGGAGVLSALVQAGGSGYAVGNTITLTGGTGTAAVLTVTSVSSGAVTGVSVTTPGSYTVLPTMPTAQGSTSGSGTGATFILRFPQSAYMKLRGCFPAGSYASNYGEMATFQPAANAAAVTQHAAFEFYSDAPRLYFRLGNGGVAYVNVVIDGVRFSLNALDNPDASGNFYEFDFRGSSGRKKRHWRIEGYNHASLIGVDSNSQVWAPDDANTITAVCISDSIMAGSGYGPFVSGNSVPQRIGHELGWNDVWNLSTGGTGYIDRGLAAGVTTDKYLTRIPQALAIDPDIWVLFGSTNDISESGIDTAVEAVIDAIRDGGSTAPIVVFGVWPLNNAGVAATEAAVAAGVDGADPLEKTWFIPLYDDPAQPWITGGWNNNPAPSGITFTTTSNGTLYISGDNAHPPDIGTEYLGVRMGSAIREQVLPYIA